MFYHVLFQAAAAVQREVTELRKRAAVLALQLEMSERTERRYQADAESARRQMTSLLEGRGHESDILLDKMQQLKDAQQVSARS
jgi:hypothetical protein